MRERVLGFRIVDLGGEGLLFRWADVDMDVREGWPNVKKNVDVKYGGEGLEETKMGMLSIILCSPELYSRNLRYFEILLIKLM